MESEQVKIRGILDNDFCAAKIGSQTNMIIDKGYGIVEKDNIFFEPTETLYLVYKGILEVSDKDGNLYTFERLLSIFSQKDPLIWVRLNLYSNLRKRGFIVRKGVGGKISFFVEKKHRENVKRYLVVGIIEGIRINFIELESLFRRSLESGRKLVLAIIDKEDNITYYMVNKLSTVEDDGKEVSDIY